MANNHIVLNFRQFLEGFIFHDDKRSNSVKYFVKLLFSKTSWKIYCHFTTKNSCDVKHFTAQNVQLLN